MTATELPPTTAWQRIWRDGLAEQLTTRGLEALRDALESDDPRLVQGATVRPDCDGESVECACAVSFAVWQGEKMDKSHEVYNRFADICHAASYGFSIPHTVSYFLNWFDDTPRDQMRRELLAEVNRTLQGRQHS